MRVAPHNGKITPLLGNSSTAVVHPRRSGAVFGVSSERSRAPRAAHGAPRRRARIGACPTASSSVCGCSLCLCCSHCSSPWGPQWMAGVFWGWWLAGAVGWLALCGLVLCRVYHREESGVGRQVQPSPYLQPSGERILATAGTGTRNPHEVVEGSVCRTNEAAPAAQARAAHIVGSLSVTSARSCCPATSCHDVSSRLS
jgi:hypothetical protein